MKKWKKNEQNASPVRVLHLIDRITGYGTTSWLWDIVRLTPPDKVRHLVITFSPDKGKWIHADRLREKGVYLQIPNTHFLKLGGGSRAWFFLRYIATWWHVFKALICFRPDIIHVHTGYVLTIGLPLKIVCRCPLVYSVPALSSQSVASGKSWVPKLYTRFHSLIDCFFSFLPQDEFLKLGIPVSKVIPMRGSIDLQEINLVKKNRCHYQKAIREKLHLTSDALIAISVGRLHPSKGHQFSLEALPALLVKFPNLHLLVIGEGKLRAELEERAKDLGISLNVHFLGFQNDLLPFYAAASVYLRTAILESENFCSHLAMGMGLPIVGFDPGGKNELIKKVGHGILVPNKDIDAFSSAVTKILSLPDRGREMGGLGLSYSEKNFDIRKAIADYTSVYIALKNGVKVQSDQIQRDVWQTANS